MRPRLDLSGKKCKIEQRGADCLLTSAVMSPYHSHFITLMADVACLTTNYLPQTRRAVIQFSSRSDATAKTCGIDLKECVRLSKRGHISYCRIARRVHKFSAQHRLSRWLCWLALLSLVFLICCKELGVLFASK